MKSCQQVTRLLSESMERKLSFWERMGLWFHLSMCKMCSGFSKDLKQLREAARQHAQKIEQGSGDADATLSDDACQRMKQALQEQDS